MTLRIGIDVGGTNTDAVLMDDASVVSKIKTPTTEDVTTGITTALTHVLESSGTAATGVTAVMIGTTHFTNAVIERRRLQRTATIRLGLPATAALPPMVDWPHELRSVVDGGAYLCHGGHEFDGRDISPFDAGEIRSVAERIAADGVKAVAISSVFSPVNPVMEEETAGIVANVIPDAAITRSAEIGRIGLLERENAAILNACLRALALETISAFRMAIARMGISAPLYLTQNDGTLMSADFAEHYPVLTFASGPTNSMRGAAFLSRLKDAIVVDIGGTTSDVGALAQGFPREASFAVEIGGVRTNFRMPDVFSFGLGGGTIVRNDPLRIGPQSVGYRITRDALVFGGETITTTDIAVAAGLADIGDPAYVAHLDGDFVRRALERMREMSEAAIDRMKTSSAPMPVIVVGGGSILLPARLAGISERIRPNHFEAANAVGAAIAQISDEVERVYSLNGQSRDSALSHARQEAADRAIEAGADPQTVRIVEVEDVPLTYLPGNATRVRVKAVGDLRLERRAVKEAAPG
jgi:N-methylhydantoinase A/oxoprolinase/acetone carboxylase beta subunit